MIRATLFLMVCGLLSNVHCRAGIIVDTSFSNIAANWNPVGATNALASYPFVIPVGTAEMLVDTGVAGTTSSSISQLINVEAGDILTFNWSAGLFPDTLSASNNYATRAYWQLGNDRTILASLQAQDVDPNDGFLVKSNSVTMTFNAKANGVLLKFGIDETQPSLNDLVLSTLTIDTLFITPSQNNNAIPEPSSAFCFATLFAAVGFYRTRRSAKV